ncbi:hypothetical protein [Singulisphaera sp. PoT]|uniref:hypothetical protein n=1 Tax=Singulisphaera sp. PoT TaxID=3411797 RepID=UPI003BF5CE01
MDRIEPDPITLAALHDLLEVDRRLEAGRAEGSDLAKTDHGRLTWHAHSNRQASLFREEWHPALVELARTFEVGSGFFYAEGDGGARLLVWWRADFVQSNVLTCVRRLGPEPRSLGTYKLGMKPDFRMVRIMLERHEAASCGGN